MADGPTDEVLNEATRASVYNVESYRIHDPFLNKELLIPAW